MAQFGEAALFSFKGFLLICNQKHHSSEVIDNENNVSTRYLYYETIDKHLF